MIINYEKVVDKLSAELDLKVKRSRLIASNIANVDTPGYKSKDLQFHSLLQTNMETLKLKQTLPGHLDDNGTSANELGQVVESPFPGRPDGNNVNIDDEMLKLTENNIKYNVAVQLLSKKLDGFKNAIDLSR